MARSTVQSQIERLQQQIATLTEQLDRAERVADERRGAAWRRLMRRASDPRVSQLLTRLSDLLDRPSDRAAFDLAPRPDEPSVGSAGRHRSAQQALDLSTTR